MDSNYEKLILKSNSKINRLTAVFKRYLHFTLVFSARFIAVKGARGVGKTTFLLQLGQKFKQKENIVYVAMDDLYFTDNNLYSFAETFEQHGGTLMLLDEIHKYPNWSRELKLIYDDFPGLKVIFTSSSILDIYKGESDLSRRVVQYTLKELSFREFLTFKKSIELQKYSLIEILKNHQEISLEITLNFKPFAYFDEYLKYGAYPYYEDDEFTYYQQLYQTLLLVLEVDLQSVEYLSHENIAKIKRLLYVLAANVPYTPNINRLSAQINLNRNTLVRVMQLMDKAEIIHALYKQSRCITSLNKPDKIWLNNTNLMYVLAKESVNKGTLRETFLLQCLSHLHELALPNSGGDLLVDQQYIFEIGGKNKSSKQISSFKNAFVIRDETETGIDHTIPLWLFGLLY